MEALPNRAQWTISGAVRVVGSADKRGALLGLREGSGAAISVYLSTEEAGGSAEEECKGRRKKKQNRAAEESRMMARCLSIDGGDDDSASLIKSQTTS